MTQRMRIHGGGPVAVSVVDDSIRIEVAMPTGYVFFQLDPDSARVVQERIGACLYQIAAMEDEDEELS